MITPAIKYLQGPIIRKWKHEDEPIIRYLTVEQMVEEQSDGNGGSIVVITGLGLIALMEELQNV